MPIWLRRFTFEKMKETFEKMKKEAEGKQQQLKPKDNKQILKPDIRTSMGKK